MNNIIKKRKGFTLVELVIVIVIVGILSVISVPIYRGYVDKAKFTEGHILVNAIAKAELAFHVKNDYFCDDYGGKGEYLDVDSRGNKYFRDWYTEANNNWADKASMNIVSKLKKMSDDDGYDTYVDIHAGYFTENGELWEVHTRVYANGGIEDIRTTKGSSYMPEPQSNFDVC
ncbi:prepilin-type N-terminal cleavage/methylation domain-containing protein [Candidatus Ruminimicrobiellum ovillum]|uniref:prepilin-type N-terminal cleavage/methylation domain-containing protein n=1 Tax=Candidatus Ruminimicrobiellum ovillum TaxID=1947927 RepID=UPI00355AC639